MGFPAEKLESIYRNSMVDVKGFFNSRHPSQYRIYNLCAEDKYQYNSAHFNDNVGLFGCYDHQAPPMKLIFSFCEDMNNRKFGLEKMRKMLRLFIVKLEKEELVL